jgi:phospholipid/cholesterol/gamma-HCH transport system substrate-binding protein
MKKNIIKNIKAFKNPLETILGASVLFVAIYFGALLFSTKSPSSLGSYDIYAEFGNVGGVAKGTDIKISGMSVGKVSATYLDKKNYKVKVEISIQDDVKFSSDSSVKIRNSGLLGDKYLEIVPGIEDEVLKEGEYLYFTQDAFDIEDMIGKFLLK